MPGNHQLRAHGVSVRPIRIRLAPSRRWGVRARYGLVINGLGRHGVWNEYDSLLDRPDTGRQDGDYATTVIVGKLVAAGPARIARPLRHRR
jgi:hypothetical protein